MYLIATGRELWVYIRLQLNHLVNAQPTHALGRDYDLPLDSASKLIDAVDEYQGAFERAMQSNINPFGEISGIMLSRSLVPLIKSLCLTGTTELKFFVHHVVGDVMTMTMTITQAMT